jgi:glycosyltransferase involved in cell wall biosynthesis
MKVALVNDFKPETGAGNYAFSLYREMRHLNPDAGMLYLESIQPLGREVSGITQISGLRLPVLNRSLNSLYVFPGRIPDGFDLYHVTNQFLGRIALKKKPVVVTCLDIIPYVLKNDYPWAMRYFLAKAIKALQAADRIITISDFTKRELIERLGFDEEKIETVYLGFDNNLFKARNQENARRKLGLPLDKRIVLHVGSEEPRKNVHSLLKALSQVKKEFPELMFIRLGEQRKETLKQTRELGLSETVKYFSSLPAERLALFYNAADVLVFPSYYEGFGLPVLEAMASACPVIVSKTTSLPEVSGQAGVSVDPFDVEAMSQAIKMIFSANSFRQPLIQRGLARSREFSWLDCAKKTRRIYEAVIG